ncbi:MAG TPA: hypothetical protein VKU19_28805 [Bryobacteraceae bacterium]|nr:hypothetical protein [Bryobacteraceae bacterium]
MHPVPNAGRLLSSSRRLEQIDRIVSSPVLQNSQALCNLLKFLARQSVEAPDTPVKEHQIATEVFGRPTNFDPRLDSTVRVQTGRLRTKLAEYYGGPGRDEPIVVEIPKGSHTVTFRERDVAAPVPAAPLKVAPVAEPIPIPRPRPHWWKWTVVGFVVMAALAAGFLAIRPAAHAISTPAAANEPLLIFWRSLLQSAGEPLVVFSNAEFVGRPETGLRYFRPGRDTAESVFDHYTGVGEVISIHELDQVFARLGRPIQLKRGRLLNWDDTKNRDLVFLGSPSENLTLRELSLGREFRFETMQDGPRKGDLGIVNLHPNSGEVPVFFGSRDLPITEDYALVELAPGPNNGQSILMLAGTTTFGTQGAVEFVCDPDRIRGLLPQVRDANGRVAPFCAVLHIKVNRGVPVEGDLVSLRRR